MVDAYLKSTDGGLVMPKTTALAKKTRPRKKSQKFKNSYNSKETVDRVDVFKMFSPPN